MLLLSLSLLLFLLAVALAAVSFAAAREQEMACEIAKARFVHRFLILAEPPGLSLDGVRAIETHHTGMSRSCGPPSLEMVSPRPGIEPGSPA